MPVTTQTPLLHITEMNNGQAQPNLTFNEAIRKLEACGQLGVTSRSLGTAPTDAADGDRYIVGSPATDIWSDHVDDIAIRQAGTWLYVTPLDGFEAWITDEADRFRYRTGSPNGWEAIVAGGGGGGGSAPVFSASTAASPSGGPLDDYAPAGWSAALSKSRLLLTPTGGDVTLNGLDASAAVDGQGVVLFNDDTANSLILKHQAGSSTAGNRFVGWAGGDVVIVFGQGKLLVRAGTRWRII